jgi:hypothetical protein
MNNLKNKIINLSQFTPLKNSNGTPLNSSTKLPVTILNDAPLERPNINLHGYKRISAKKGGRRKRLGKRKTTKSRKLNKKISKKNRK